MTKSRKDAALNSLVFASLSSKPAGAEENKAKAEDSKPVYIKTGEGSAASQGFKPAAVDFSQALGGQSAATLAIEN